MSDQEKTFFLLKNLAKGLSWLAVLVIGFILFKHYLGDTEQVIREFGNKPILIYSIYFVSEIVVGIIPPELFMMWSLELGEARNYISDIALLSIISYLAGIATFYFGHYFNQTIIYRYIRKKYLQKYEIMFMKFGGFLIFVAAITPVPYSGVCMLMGAVNYPTKKFFIISLTRFIRFALYGYILWQASLIS